jgi:hypothetical protein
MIALLKKFIQFPWWLKALLGEQSNIKDFENKRYFEIFYMSVFVFASRRSSLMYL